MNMKQSGTAQIEPASLEDSGAQFFCVFYLCFFGSYETKFMQEEEKSWQAIISAPLKKSGVRIGRKIPSM